MSFQSREQFTSAQASEKITLVHAHATTRLSVWNDDGGGLYSKAVPYFVTAIKNVDTPLTMVSDLGSVTAGSFYYSPQLGRVYVHNSGSVDPDTVDMIVTYRFFFSSRTMDQTWDLNLASSSVSYQGRIVKSPEYKHKIGIDQNLISLVGKGALILNNNDGYFDDIYDTLYFENQTISVYSWNKDLDITDAKLIFRGKVTNKSFGSEKVTFTVKDSIFDLNQNVPQTVYDDNDNVDSSVKGQYKRWIYGRVDGLKIQSVDQISDGYDITGTASSVNGIKELSRFENFTLDGTAVQGKYFLMSTAKDEDNIYYWYGTSGGGTDPGPIVGYPESRKIIVTLGDTIAEVEEKTSIALSSKFTIIPGTGYFLVENKEFGEATNSANVDAGITISTLKDGVSSELIEGTGTQFLSEVSPNDTITFGTQEFSVEEILSDTQLLVSKAPEYQFTNITPVLVPEIPTVDKNRDFFVADHICAELTKTVVSVKQFNRVQLSDVDGLIAGDYIEFSSGERIEIKSFAPGNIVVLRKNVLTLPPVSSNVTRPPVQNIYVGSKQVEPDDYTIDNSGPLKITLDTDVEFNLAPNKTLNQTLAFTNASRTITASPGANLTEIFKPRDWVRPVDLDYTTFYEILSVSDEELVLRTPFLDPTISNIVTYKQPEYVGDNTVISANVLGRTVDGTSSGLWISTAAQAIKDAISSIGITQIDTASFTQGSLDNQQIVSLPIPVSPGNSGTTVKDVVDEISNSVLASISLNNDLQIKYKALLAEVDDDIPTIDDKQLISWSVKAVNGNIYGNTVIRYRHRDIDRYTQEEGNNAVTYTSEFVNNYIGTNKSQEVDARLYNESDAVIRAHRTTYYNRLGRAEIELVSDLRLENYEIGDSVQLDIARLYKRLGANDTRLKVATIVGKEVTGNEVKLVLSDLGNLYNVSSVITPNDAPDYSVSTTEDKIKYGYITDNQGIVDDDDQTGNIHLIS